MNRLTPDDWSTALLTAASFAAMIVVWTIACLDAIGGSPGCGPEFAVALVCAASFASLLR